VIDVVICGIRGRMGQTLAALVAADSAARIVGGIGREAADGGEAERYGCPRIVAAADAGSITGAADVVIDFSSAAATAELLRVAGDALAGRAVVIGTTGLDGETESRIAALAARSAVLTAANFSVGVNLLAALTAQAAAALDARRYDVEIVEAHHARKIDAPSGTALALGEAVARGRDRPLTEIRRDGRSGVTGPRPGGEVGFHAIRGGGVVGDHHVLFLGERERIELRHEALDRALFAEGALHAAHWLATRDAGRYTMAEVLGIGS
jgi:4-hydroxy-tetrahydrodipicolinate reductase